MTKKPQGSGRKADARARSGSRIPDWDDDDALLDYLKIEVAEFLDSEQYAQAAFDEGMPNVLDVSASFADTIAIDAAKRGDYGPIVARLKQAESGHIAPLAIRWVREQVEKGGGAFKARATKKKKSAPRSKHAVVIEDIIRSILHRDYGRRQRGRDLKSVTALAAEIAGVPVRSVLEKKKRG